MRKKIKNLKLLKIYFNYCFNIKTIVILCLSLLITGLAIYFMTSLNIELEEYLLSYNNIHMSFINQSNIIIEIINAFIISTIINHMVSSQANFDSLFVSYIPRSKISLVKILSVSMIIFIFIYIEVLIISYIGYIEYPYYKIISNGINLLTYHFILAFIEISIAFIISLIITNNFSLIISSISFVSFTFIKTNLTLDEEYDKIIPDYNNLLSNTYPYIGILCAFIGIIGFIYIYSNQNIKNIS